MYFQCRLEKKSSALSVSHDEALKWFRRRRATYDRLISAAASHIQSDGVIFDVGANVGYFSLLLAERLNFKGSMYLFEPVPHLAELCETTFQNTPYDVKVLNFGLSDTNGETEIFVSSDGNLGWNTLVAEKATPDMTKIRIPLRTFDSCGIDMMPSFIKIDVEGAECRVLRGMLGSLQKWRPLPVVLCEVGWGRDHPEWEQELRMFEEMRRLGYVICNLEGAVIDEKRLTETTDILFLPQDGSVS